MDVKKFSSFTIDGETVASKAFMYVCFWGYNNTYFPRKTPNILKQYFDAAGHNWI